MLRYYAHTFPLFLGMLTDLTDQVYTSDSVVLSRTMMMLRGTVVSSLDQIRAVAPSDNLGGDSPIAMTICQQSSEKAVRREFDKASEVGLPLYW